MPYYLTYMCIWVLFSIPTIHHAVFIIIDG